ncbi:MAG: DNA topoisomerase I [Candidatus Pacearchaeota archaeon]|jgi:DNA topoisomerase-1
MAKLSKKAEKIKNYEVNQIKENFVPIDEKDLAHAVDVPVKEKKTEEIEFKSPKARAIKEKRGKRTTKKKVIKKSANWAEEFKVPGPEKLNPKGSILIITEKPQAANKIADALSRGKSVKKNLEGVSYYEFERDGKPINVVCAVGHLFTLAQVKPRNVWPTFDIKWAPNYLVRKNDFTKKYYDVIARIVKKASSIIVATDYDIEGEVIGMNIVRYICNQKDAERMKFSTLTANEISESYEKRSKSLDWKQGIAGETRHYLDWIYGINLSRALMDAVKSAGSFRLMSIGRVQGPALNIIVKKEHEIMNFKSEKYWDVSLDIDDGKNLLEVKYTKGITKEKDLEKFKHLEKKEGEVKTEKSQQRINPPVPFDLTTLQIEAYKFFKITPSKTLEIAQSLYLSGIISYPRTSSQKIPKEIGYDVILDRLSKRFNFVKFAEKTVPIEGKKTDPAHPSIYPTGEFHSLEGEEERIYDLIVRRFVSCFCNEAILDNKKIEFVIDGMKFNTKGMAIADAGWMEVYRSEAKERELPDMNGKATVKKVKIEEKMTQPPHRYTPASIVSELEKKNLGTKATRANILETLYDRSYIKEKSIQATSLGISLIDTLNQNCPIIVDEKLTRDIEKHLDAIRESKNPLDSEKKVLDETKKVLYRIGEDFEKNKLKIGQSLIEATTKLWEEEKKQGQIGVCPVCKKGNLTIKYGKKFSRYFVACDAYPDCKTTYSLPPNALIKKTDKVCAECGFPMLMSLKKGKRPWIFCFNPNCASRKEKIVKEVELNDETN